MKALIHVTLKKDVLDPQGKAIRNVKIRQIMNPNPTFIYSDEMAVRAIEVMESRKKPLTVLPVIDRKHRSVGMVHIDAHCDTGSNYLGSNYHHGAPFARAVEEGLLDPGRTVQIGIRGGVNDRDVWKVSHESGMRVIYMPEFYEIGLEAAMAEARRVVGDGPTYVSFDIDSLDPAYAPGTGTPEIGGLTSLEAQLMIRQLQGLDLIGADVVEVSPPFDPSGLTALTGASMMFELLCVLADAVAARKSRG